VLRKEEGKGGRMIKGREGEGEEEGDAFFLCD
jgi:hypothetical protein